MKRIIAVTVASAVGLTGGSAIAQRGGAAGTGPAATQPTRAQLLRGEYGKWRANNDLLSYVLDVRVDPTKKWIGGKNTIRMKMLSDDTRVQLDLWENYKVEKVVWEGKELKVERESGTVWVDFPEVVKAGREVSLEFYYSGNPSETGRFGGFTFRKDPAGRDWIYSSCEGPGASVWWPNKDQWKDEPQEGVEIRVAAPNGMTDVSNGRFLGKTDLGDGYTRWDWKVSYPINNYCVSVNIGTYEHFSDKLGELTLDFYCLPEDLEKAKETFAQAKGMIEAYEHYFGEYPFIRDGYKLVQAPYSGMEHQSAVTYGNGFRNGYGGRDWTGVGISPKFDFIIIHESGHEWFGNAVTAADKADMWIHEGWTTYLEGLYVEYRWGKEDAIKYLNGYKTKVQNRQPIVGKRGINGNSPQDQYFKGALFLNTLRSVVDDDAKWFSLIKGFFQTYKYQDILTEDVIGYFNKETGKDLTAIFNEYLRHAPLPVLELKWEAGKVQYRWRAEEAGFAMPVRVGKSGAWLLVTPGAEWKEMETSLSKDDFKVDVDHYYVGVEWK